MKSYADILRLKKKNSRKFPLKKLRCFTGRGKQSVLSLSTFDFFVERFSLLSLHFCSDFAAVSFSSSMQELIVLQQIFWSRPSEK